MGAGRLRWDWQDPFAIIAHFRQAWCVPPLVAIVLGHRGWFVMPAREQINYLDWHVILIPI
jgi:hypothetical protein